MSFISKLANNVESFSRGALETAGVIKRGSLTAVELDTLKRRRIDLTLTEVLSDPNFSTWLRKEEGRLWCLACGPAKGLFAGGASLDEITHDACSIHNWDTSSGGHVECMKNFLLDYEEFLREAVTYLAEGLSAHLEGVMSAMVARVPNDVSGDTILQGVSEKDEIAVRFMHVLEVSGYEMLDNMVDHVQDWDKLAAETAFFKVVGLMLPHVQATTMEDLCRLVLAQKHEDALYEVFVEPLKDALQSENFRSILLKVVRDEDFNQDVVQRRRKKAVLDI